MSQEKEAQTKFHKTRDDKELEKIIALENKIKVLDDIVYKTGQLVQTMNILNRNCKTSFVNPGFLKKAQKANPRLYDISCYNDNLALMLAPESDETIQQIKNDKAFKENQSNIFLKEREQYFEIQDLKAQLQDKGIAISELKKLIEKMKGKYMETKFEKPSTIRQPNAFKSQRQSVLGLTSTTSVSRPWLKSNQLEDRVLHNNSEGKKHQVEDHRRNFKFSNNTSLIEIILFIIDSGCSKHMTGNLKLLSSRGIDLYSITLQDTSTPNPICLMAKATSSQAWLWHRRLSHLNFDSINLLSKNGIVIGIPKVKFVKDILCSSCEYTWTHFLRSKDETPDVLIDFLRLVQRGLHAQVRTVGTDNGIEFLNKTLHAYFSQEGIELQTSTAQTPKQNGVIEIWNHTLFEFARTMLSVAKVPFLSPGPQSQENVPQAAKTVTTSNELDLLFSLMFDELLNGTTPVVSKSSAVTATDAPNQRQQQHTTPFTSTIVATDTPPLNIQITPATTSQEPTQASTVTVNENIIQAETTKEYA
ncbi:retrovirus-related pol polyprotein from transposon TNT 1-94 [Tanacetum coccineum]